MTGTRKADPAQATPTIREEPSRGGVICLTVTEAGRAIAQRLPYRHVHGDAGATLRREWASAGGFVVVLAVGATVRLAAPLLSDKQHDPCVVCVDDAGRYAVVVSGGHAGGGNALAREVAGLTGALAVVTTASDVTDVPALDQIPGFRVEGAVSAVATALLDGRPVTLDNEAGWPVPEPLSARCTSAGDPVARIVVTDREVPAPRPPDVPTAVLHPRSLTVGIGTTSDATPEEADDAVRAALSEAALSAASVALVASIDRRREHPALQHVAAALDAPLATYGPDALDEIAVPSPSDTVRRAVGTGSVAEAAALLAAGPGASIVLGKRTTKRVTVAIGRRSGPRGDVVVVGLGPGSPAHRTPAAVRAIRHAEVVVGYDAYLEQCRDLLVPAQRVLAFPLGAELDRARVALGEAAEGRRVALVCSGDAGIYAMASPLMELPESADIDIEVVPGVTAGLAAAALLGAPVGHDHALVSLSDLHTPWDVIARRLRAAAEGDFVVVLYNPRSNRRSWQLVAARDILMEHRLPTTPVGIVSDAGRPGQRVVRTTLRDMPVEEVHMTTCVVVGSRTTRMVAGRMVTPRGYST